MNTLQQNLARNKQMAAALAARKKAASASPLPMVKPSAPVNPAFKPLNIGDINKIMWPFFFTFSAPVLVPGASASGFFTVTQEAGFNMLSLCKVVFKRTGVAPNYDFTAIDSDREDNAIANANGLTITLRDSQSSRVFMSQPLPIDMIGSSSNPFIFPSPQFMLPNATMEMTFQNNSTTETFVPWITTFGYRVRISDAQNILSTITG